MFLLCRVAELVVDVPGGGVEHLAGDQRVAEQRHHLVLEPMPLRGVGVPVDRSICGPLPAIQDSQIRSSLQWLRYLRRLFVPTDLSRSCLVRGDLP
jgi:hypothetical protein